MSDTQDALRRLRRCRRVRGGILDCRCARRSARRQVGTKGWPFSIEQRDGTGCSRAGGLANLVGGVEQRLLFEQGAGLLGCLGNDLSTAGTCAVRLVEVIRASEIE